MGKTKKYEPHRGLITRIVPDAKKYKREQMLAELREEIDETVYLFDELDLIDEKTRKALYD